MHSIKLTPKPFSFTHKYVTLAIIESLFLEGSFSSRDSFVLDELDHEDVCDLWHDYVKSVNLEVCCVKE